jgi:hypothetical protein
MTSEELRASLRDQIQDRRRERGPAWERFDNLLDKRANGAVAQPGDADDVTPVSHQHRI